jgi:anti-sigma B factor antagonist
MQIQETVRGDVVILSFSGRILDEEANAEITRKMTSLITDGARKVIVDLGRVRLINSRGLSTLISVVKAMQSNGGDVRFAEVGRELNNIFVETRLVNLFRTYETVGRAFASYYHELPVMRTMQPGGVL